MSTFESDKISYAKNITVAISDESSVTAITSSSPSMDISPPNLHTIEKKSRTLFALSGAFSIRRLHFHRKAAFPVGNQAGKAVAEIRRKISVRRGAIRCRNGQPKRCFPKVMFNFDLPV